jgi:ribosomal protein S18 acetylase RimI-like enzyme
MSIRYRKCNETDLEKLVWISVTTFYEAFVSKNTAESMKGYMDYAFNPQKLKGELNNLESEFYFTYYDDQLVGFFKINKGTAQVEIFPENTIELERIYVLKEFRNKQIGEKMLMKAIEIGNKSKAEFIWLGVWEKNPEAQRFYERHGFKKFGQHPFFMGTEEQTDILMRLYLES